MNADEVYYKVLALEEENKSLREKLDATVHSLDAAFSRIYSLEQKNQARENEEQRRIDTWKSLTNIQSVQSHGGEEH